MALLRFHCDSDCNKIQIIRNFHLYVIHLWEPFFHIFTHELKIRRWLGNRQLCNSRCSCHFLMTFQREFYKIYCVWIAKPFYMALVGMAGLPFTSQRKKFALCVECHCQVHVLILARKQGMVVILPPMQWLSKR